MKSVRILTYTYTAALTTKQVATKVLFSPSLVEYIPFHYIPLTYNNSLSQSQQQIQATDIQEEEIRMSLNLPHVEGTSEKLRHILRSHKVISTLYTESTLRKLLCKLKNQVAAE